MAGHFIPQAMASSRVDLPDPFSPTKIVTGASKASVDRACMQGTVKG